MKKITALILSVVLVFSLVACSNTQQNDASDPVSDEEPSLVAESTPAEGTETEGSNILIAYFTYGENAELPDDVDASASASIQIFNGEVTGNTGVMARMIAEAWHSSRIGYAYRKSGSVRYDFCWLPKLVVWYAYGNV